MNRKALSLLIAVVMVLSVVPAGLAYAAPNRGQMPARYAVPLLDDTGLFLMIQGFS